MSPIGHGMENPRQHRNRWRVSRLQAPACCHGSIELQPVAAACLPLNERGKRGEPTSTLIPYNARRGRVVTTLICACVLLALSVEVQAQADTNRRLRLTETQTITVDDLWEFRGGTLSPEGDLVVWDGRKAILIRMTGVATAAGPTTLCPNLLRSPVAAAFHPDTRTIEVVDAQLRSVVRVDDDARCLAQAVLPLDGDVLMGARTAAGWVLAISSTETGEVQLRALDTHGRERPFAWPADSASPRNPRIAWLTANGNELVLASMLWPFNWVVADTVGQVLLRGSPIKAGSTAMPELQQNELLDWVGLNVLPLDTGFIQVVSDPRGDRRLLVLFDPDAQVLRRTVVHVPFGLIASAPKNRELIGLRRTDRLELVRYRWHWNW